MGWKDSRRGVQKQDPRRSLRRGAQEGALGRELQGGTPVEGTGSISRRESNKRVLGVPGPPEASVSPGVAGRSLQEGSRQPPSRVPGSELSFFKSHKMHKRRNPIGDSEQSQGEDPRVPGVFRDVRVGVQEHFWEVSRRPWSGLQVDSWDKAPGLPWVPRATGCGLWRGSGPVLGAS